MSFLYESLKIIQKIIAEKFKVNLNGPQKINVPNENSRLVDFQSQLQIPTSVDAIKRARCVFFKLYFLYFSTVVFTVHYFKTYKSYHSINNIYV
jgi:hypothetical protein